MLVMPFVFLYVYYYNWNPITLFLSAMTYLIRMQIYENSLIIPLAKKKKKKNEASIKHKKGCTVLDLFIAVSLTDSRTMDTLLQPPWLFVRCL